MTRSALHAVVENAPDLMPSTRDKYLRDLNAWVDFAGTEPANWTPAATQAFYNGLISRGMKPQSADRLLASVAYAAKWWSTQLNKPDLYFVQIRHSKKRDKLPKRSLNDAECEALVRTCLGSSIYDKRDLALIIVGLETGMRRMSLTSMQCGSTTVVGENGYPATKVATKGRGEELLSVPLSTTAILALRPWLTAMATSARLTPHGPAPSSPVFQPIIRMMAGPVPDGGALSPSAIAKILIGRAEQAGIGRVNPHMFRHTFVTDRSARGYKPHEIAAMTGHSLNLGALGMYMDMKALGEKIRDSTPEWLAKLIAAHVGSPLK